MGVPFIASFFTNALSAFGPVGTSAGSVAYSLTRSYALNGTITKGDLANAFISAGIGFGSGKLSHALGGAEDWSDGISNVAGAEISSIINSVWSWITPY